MNKLYTLRTKGDSDIFYEDNSCLAKIVAADFRDIIWYVGVDEVIEKKTQNRCKLSLTHKRVLYQRLSYELHIELFTDEFGFIMCEDRNSVFNNFVDLLEVSD